MSSERRKVLRYFEEQAELMNDRVTSGIELYRKGWFKIKVKGTDKISIRSLLGVVRACHIC